MTADFGVTSRTMSKRVLGIGIIATGGLILAIALIIGLEFPSFIYQRNLEDVCILDKKHDRYKTWVSTEYLLSKHDRLYNI